MKAYDVIGYVSNGETYCCGKCLPDGTVIEEVDPIHPSERADIEVVCHGCGDTIEEFEPQEMCAEVWINIGGKGWSRTEKMVLAAVIDLPTQADARCRDEERDACQEIIEQMNLEPLLSNEQHDHVIGDRVLARLGQPRVNAVLELHLIRKDSKLCGSTEFVSPYDTDERMFMRSEELGKFVIVTCIAAAVQRAEQQALEWVADKMLPHLQAEDENVLDCWTVTKH